MPIDTQLLMSAFLAFALAISALSHAASAIRRSSAIWLATAWASLAFCSRSCLRRASSSRPASVMSARELDELIQAKKAAEDERDLYEQKLAEQMGAAERLKKDAETAAQEAEARCRELAETQAQIRALQENIRTLESRPVEVAVQVDEGAVAKAREEEKAAAKKELERLEKKLQKAEKAREQAEATAKAAEDKLETAAADVAKERDGLKLELQEARRKLEMSDVTVAQFKIVFDTVQGNLNDMLALIAKASGENQTKLRAAAEKLVDAFKGRIES